MTPAAMRTFDRQLAYLGLLDDAAPIFRDGSQVSGVGVLLALPCLVHSGLMQIARKLYGKIGPAFYGLRTTLLTLFLMALLRIQRPEQLKERDPAALGRLLGLDRSTRGQDPARRQLGRVAAHHRAEQLRSGTAARVRVAQRGELKWVFCTSMAMYAPTTGSARFPRPTWLGATWPCLPPPDYWINGDRAGDPFAGDHCEDINACSLAKALPNSGPRCARRSGDRRGDHRL